MAIMAEIIKGSTPIGDIFLDNNSPELIHAKNAINIIEVNINLILNWLRLFLSIFTLLIWFKVTIAIIKINIVKNAINGYFPLGKAASTGIAGISRRLNIKGDIYVSLPNEKPAPIR